ncbi:MAG: nucleotidyltransferase family protein [Lachnospiraceae bacterium]|nr:nucleotidyltransferase family protein [Lachnospiraceae bacterium]
MAGTTNMAEAARMTETEKAFLTILRDALHPGNDTDLGYDCELDITDWADVLTTAKMQNLFPFIYDAATAYPSFSAFEEAHPECFPVVTASMTAQMQKTDAFLSLYKSFLSAGLSPITMKGIICRELYGERADFRPSGDEDILIEKKDYEKAVEILEACGYRKEADPDKEMAVIQEVTFHSEELTVELHLNPFGVDSTTREKMNDWFRDVFRSKEIVKIKGVPVRTMTPTDHLLFLVFHAFKHFTGGGFGIRMMLDILLFAEKYGERIDWEYVDAGLADVGATGFLADLVEIGDRYLGFTQIQRYNSVCRLETVCPDELLEDMFRRGTFGNSSNADRTAGRIVADTVQKGKSGKTGKNGSESKLKSYFRLLFPSWKTWCAWRPYLKDRPWMVVCEWFWRIGRYIRGETSSSNMTDLDKSYKIAEERMILLGKYGVL